MFLLFLLEYSILFMFKLINADNNKLLDLSTYNDLHNEGCNTDFNCANEMRCEKDTRICICIDGFIFASNIAMCEVSKKFDKFSIQGPSIIYLNQTEVYFDIIFHQYEDRIRSNWIFEWTIKSGKECAQFSGIKTRTFKMKILKAGFINFAISISNATFSGYRQHNLTIYDHNLLPIAKVENLNVSLPLNFVCLNAENSLNAKYFKWIPEDNLPAEMLSGSSLDDSKLFLSNLVPGVFQFNLSIWNDHSPINDTKIVKLFVFGGTAEENLIELISSFNNFTFKYLTELSSEIEQILEQQEDEDLNNNIVLVKFTKISSSEATLFGNVFTSFYFYVTKQSKNEDILDGEQIISLLQTNLTFQKHFGIIQISPYYCKKCSGHGKCDNLTKSCICDDFWMPNIFVKIMNNGRNLDCSWPSIIVWLSLFFATFIFIKFLIFYWNKNELKRLQKSKLIKKILLQHDDNQKCFKQNGRFSPVKMSKRRKNRGGGGNVGDCLNEFRRMFLEYSEQFGISNNLKNKNESICLKEFDDSSSSD
uniref:Uncharacterized protein n=2 Tax=Meloidogyne TaxID=189290 RepID=A0A6V7UH63_MELEN|nr:unnamed protein product [Meloidogyne enterolobii]